MNTCKTCKHWAGKVGGMELPMRDIKGGRFVEMFGRCERPNIETFLTLESPMIGAVGKGWLCGISIKTRSPQVLAGVELDFCTGPEFGCVHHQQI